jgi:hypothetical protein
MIGIVTTHENELRTALGIPEDAERVLIFAESSHWDPDWLFTSDEYYERFVRSNLDQALVELEREPRRIYSVECMFFLRMYWDREPEQREQVRRFVNERRLRLTSSGVTTADTLIPSPEAILRDFLLGQEWLRHQGMLQEPKLAYFSDSFGSSPALPSLLRAAGFSQTAITRIDGMYFLGLEPNSPRRYPRPGSSAELLLKREGSLDFIWRDRTGAELLAHWNAFTYGQGDLLAHRGLSRIYLFPFATPARSDRHIARRIRRFAHQLAPVSRTPYLLCPIGFDFVAPIKNLVELLDRYNRTHFQETGLWAVNAGLDDYLDLVDCHRDELPKVELDPNPYWTGFYTARPALKARCHELVEKLTLAESLALQGNETDAARSARDKLRQVWWTAAVSNHHDFITGTSPDRVVYQEQIPWLNNADLQVDQAIESLSAEVELPAADKPNLALPAWSRTGSRIEIRTSNFNLELDETAGGAVMRAEDLQTGEPLLAGPGNDIVRYRVSGGLWRMGYEFRGGRWREAGRSSEHTSRLAVYEGDHRLEVSWVTGFDGELFDREMWIYDDDPRLYFRIVGRAGRRRTMTVSFASGLEADELVMDQPGGVVKRPLEKVYSPTFWPFQHFVHVRDRHSGRGLALYQRWPGAVSFSHDGELSTVALRNAAIERAYALLPLSGNPARGYEKESYTFDYAIEFTKDGDWQSNALAEKAYRRFHTPEADSSSESLQELRLAKVILSRPDVFLLAYKMASRGPGRILRLYTLSAVGETIKLRLQSEPIRTATLCDARERDLEPLPVSREGVELKLPGTITTLRVQV